MNSNSSSTDDPNTTSLKVNDSFSSHAELLEKIKQFQKETFSTFNVRDSVSEQKGAKLYKGKTLKSGIKYFSIKYTCIHGGRDNRQSTSTGVRESWSLQGGCTAKFSVLTNSTGDALVIKSADFNHNNAHIKEAQECLPRNRRLTSEEKEMAKQYLQLGANKKKLKSHIQDLTGKKVISKDLSNLTPRKKDGNDLQKIIQMLQDEYGADCEVLVKDETFEGILFVTEQMKKLFEAYPEFIGVDATYKLLDLRAPLYLIVVEDSQGYTEIVAGSILMHETFENVQWFMDKFKEKHPACDKIITVMADKDFTEREVIKQSFPAAKLLICIYHLQRTFHRELTTEKLGITSRQKETAKKIIQKMIYSKSEDEYSNLYEQLKTETPISVQEYFDKNWHHLRKEWTLCGDFLKLSFLNTTNNRLESLNGKIKSIAARYATLEKFIKDFFILILTRQTERDVVAAYSYLKRRAVLFEKNSAEQFYSKHLTNYAFQFVRQELEKRKFYEVTGLDPENGDLTVQRTNSNKSRIITDKSCSCDVHLSMGLPCRHIFAAREYLNVSLADESLCLQRWTQTYYMQNQRVFEKCRSENSRQPELRICSHETPETKIKSLTQGQKLKIGKNELLEVNKLLSEMSTSKFYESMQFFSEVKERILAKKEFILSPLPEDLSSLSTNEVSFNGSEIPLPHEEVDEMSRVLENGEKVSNLVPLDENEESLPQNEALHENDEGATNQIPLEENEELLPPNEALHQNDEGASSQILLEENQESIAQSEALLSENEDAPPKDEEILLESSAPCVLLDLNCEVLNLSSVESDFAIINVGQKNDNMLLDMNKLDNIKMPPAIKMRGRPRNSLTTTVIGLSKKQYLKKNSSIPFLRKGAEAKIRQTLKWIVADSVVEKALKGAKIEENEVEIRPEKVSTAILDDEVNILLIKKYFNVDAWMAVTNLLEIKKDDNVWYCGNCQIDISDPVEPANQSNRSIRCDSCLEWFHQSCVNLKKCPKTIHWYCQKCK